VEHPIHIRVLLLYLMEVMEIFYILYMTIENLTMSTCVLVQTWNLLVVDVKKKIIRIKKWQQ